MRGPTAQQGAARGCRPARLLTSVTPPGPSGASGVAPLHPPRTRGGVLHPLLLSSYLSLSHISSLSITLQVLHLSGGDALSLSLALS